MSKVCTNCNAENLEEAKFCRKCGKTYFNNKESNFSEKTSYGLNHNKEIKSESFKENMKKKSFISNKLLEQVIIYLLFICQFIAIVWNLFTFYTDKTFEAGSPLLVSGAFFILLWLHIVSFIYYSMNSFFIKKISNIYIISLFITVGLQVYDTIFIVHYITMSAIILVLGFLIFFLIRNSDCNNKRNDIAIHSSVFVSFLITIFVFYKILWWYN